MPRTPRKSEVLASSLVSSVNHALGKLLDIWHQIGIKEEMQLERMQAVKQHIEDLLNEMITEECQLKERIESSIERRKKELTSLRNELSLDPYLAEEDISILQMEKDLRLALDATLKEKNERLEELKQLQQQDEKLCAELFTTPYYIPTGSIPSRLQLEELKEHVRMRSDEKKRRLEVFLKLRNEIRQYNEEIGHTPDSTLEKEALSDDEEPFCLTNKNIEALQTLVYKLQLKKESVISTREALKEKVRLLWNRLRWPLEKQEQCKMNIKGSITQEVTMWEEELLRLEELKKENLKGVIGKVRQELDLYWEKCLYSTEQKSAFHPYYDDNFTEDLLNQHDEEVMKMKLFYEKNKALYDGIAKWEATWKQFMELEKKSTNPNRLVNRGGTLLKEERERSKIHKLLTKLGEDLKRSIESWEKEQGCNFLIKGQRFLDYMANQWEQHKLKKEQERLTKKEDSAVLKTPMKRHAGSTTQTPLKTRKLHGVTNFTVLRAASCISLTSTGTAAVARTPIPVCKTPSKSTPPESLQPARLQEDKENQQTSKSINQFSYLDFTEYMVLVTISQMVLLHPQLQSWTKVQVRKTQGKDQKRTL
ncbi:protein regulator of cytokinesis 1-like isoform X1 [Mauremys reevesii]|uniref:protein regulator of cytokinesis 1-like isoform X1 n=2 Tax=Mauremys reevesii TaxID=260615 RepID=UPI00193EFF44|nr:protein regulator of cytokinesis 1-like isoform X1 [Mauremys reevesii]